MLKTAMIVLPLLTSPAWARTALELAILCDAVPSSPDASKCIFYLDGLREGIAADHYGRRDKAAICIPDSVSMNDLRQAVVGYIFRSGTSGFNLPSANVVAAGLVETYPCQK